MFLVPKMEERTVMERLEEFQGSAVGRLKYFILLHNRFTSPLRACLHGGGVTRLAGSKNGLCLHAILPPRGPG